MTNFAGKTVGLMVASGFDEATFIAIQKAMLAANAKLKIISRDAGLTNAWNGTGWGMSYPVDSTLSTTLAVDYDALIIPQGDRHIEKLSTEVHAKRILRAFLRENMPVLILADAIKILDIVDMAILNLSMAQMLPGLKIWLLPTRTTSFLVSIC
jgi:protease I